MTIDGSGYSDVKINQRDPHSGKLYRGIIRLFKPFRVTSIIEGEDNAGVKRHIVNEGVPGFAIDAQNLEHAVQLLTNGENNDSTKS